MAIHLTLGEIAGILSAFAFIPYIYKTIWGTTEKPSRVTWFIWAIPSVLLLFSHRALGGAVTEWVPLVQAVGVLTIALLSIKYGQGGALDLIDWLCLFGAGVSLATWAVFNSPLSTLVINLIIEALGLIPTIRKTWKNPDSEPWLPWTIDIAANGINVVAVEKLLQASSIYPIFLLVETTIIALLAFRSRWNKLVPPFLQAR